MRNSERNNNSNSNRYSNWLDEKSTFIIERDGNEIKKVSGRYKHNSAMFEFSITSQRSGRYPMRGKVSALSSTGKILKKRGRKREKILSEIPEELRNQPIRKLNVERTVNCKETDEDSIKRCVEQAAIKLYSENFELITLQLAQSSRPDTISPSVAAIMHSHAFVSIKHSRASEAERVRCEKRLKNACFKMPECAMIKITPKMINSWVKEKNIASGEMKELHDFWKYCIEHGVCTGTNPIELPKNKRNKGKTYQERISRVYELDSEQLSNFIELVKNPVTDVSVGVALMASGFDPKHIVTLTWKDIEFHKEKDFVVVRYFKELGSEATKNYSRPAIPWVAEIIREHYNNVKKENKEKGRQDISNVFVVRSKRASGGQYRAQYLVQDATKYINKAGTSFRILDSISKEDRTYAAARKILNHTYYRMLHKNCNLADDPGTEKFLRGDAFKMDTTSSAYTSFTSPEAERRLYTILKILRKDSSISNDKTNNGADGIWEFKPNRIHSRLQVAGKVILKPGEEIKIICPHGVVGNIETGVVKESNSKNVNTENPLGSKML